MRLEIQLPKTIECSDYHGFATIEESLRELCNKIRVKEIGECNGMYVGMVYEYGTLQEPECQNMIRKILQKTRSEEE